MPASEAMPAIEDVRRLVVSHPANSWELVAFYAKVCYHYCVRLHSPKAKDPLSACNAAGPSNQPRSTSPMDGLRYLTNYTPRIPIMESPQAKFAGAVCVSEVL
jgi:hypothetical protein